MRPIEPRLGGFYRLYYLKQQQEQPSKPSEPPPLPRHEPAEFQDYVEYMQRHELPPPKEVYAIKGFEEWVKLGENLAKAAESKPIKLDLPVEFEGYAEFMKRHELPPPVPEAALAPHEIALLTGFALAFPFAPGAALVGAAVAGGTTTAFDIASEGRVPSPKELGMSMLAGGISSVATAKVMEKLVVPKASEWLTKRYTEYEKAVVEAVRKGEQVKLGEWRGWSEKLVMKLTGAKPHLALGEVHIPVGEVLGPQGYEVIPETLPYTDIGWELTLSPKMSGVMIQKYPTLLRKGISIPAAVASKLSAGELKALEQMLREEPMPEDWLKGFQRESIAKHKPNEYIPRVGSFERRYIYAAERKGEFFFERGYGKPPTLQELMREMKLLPLTTQTQVTRLGIHPYIPKLDFDAALFPSIIPEVGSILAGVISKLVKPKPSETAAPKTTPKISPEVSPKTFSLPKTFKLPKLFQFPLPDIMEKTETREKIVPIIKAEPSTAAEGKQVQRAATIAVSKITLPKTFISGPAFKETFTFPKMFPSKRKGRRGLTGWYRWDYPVMDPSKLLRMVMGEPARRRKLRTHRARAKKPRK